MSSIVGYLLDIEHKYPALSVQSNDHIKMNKQKKKKWITQRHEIEIQ